MNYELKDSGARSEFSTGSVRDLQEGKGRFDLVPLEGLWRLAKLYEKGAIKYGESNWCKGQPFSVVLNSTSRHLHKYIGGWRDEDHMAAVAFGVFAIMTFEERIKQGRLPSELNDLPEILPVELTVDSK